MFESDLVAEVAQVHASVARIATAIDTGVSGPVADELLTELLAVARQVELGVCRAVERVDRTGQSCADGVSSTAAFVRRRINERGEWASKRVAAGRALADRLPFTSKGWEAGRLGLEHACVIDHATRQLEDPLRRLACDADIIPAVLGADSEILDLGRRARIANAALRAAVLARDGGCFLPRLPAAALMV